MLRKVFDQVVGALTSTKDEAAGAEGHEAALRMATAVLMLEVAGADYVFDESEFERVLRLMEVHFKLSPEQAAELVNSAEDKAEESVSVHDFTQLLHENLDETDKAQIVSLLWQIAYADGRLDKYEDALVLKISDLLYVSRGRVMRLKHDAERAAR